MGKLPAPKDTAARVSTALAALVASIEREDAAVGRRLAPLARELSDALAVHLGDGTLLVAVPAGLGKRR